MCGFYTILSKTKKFTYNDKIVDKYLRHRGPDSKKKFLHNEEIFFLTKFYRLSIIDVEKRSNQPFKFKNLIITFNGEIYNFIEIKKYLKHKYEAEFETEGDTEVLIQYLFYEGIKNINKLKGMWSFILFDKKTKKTIVCRDRFGEKNLFFYFKKKEIHICSETAAIVKNLKLNKINENYVNKYLFCSYRYLNFKNETLYENIFSVEPGSYLIIDKNLNVKKKIYFRKNLKLIQSKLTRSNLVKNTKNLLKDTVKKTMRSDVKLAFCLSGGVDSTGLVSIAKKYLDKNIKTYTIYSDDKKYNEFDAVKKTIKKLKIKNHRWVYLSKKNTFKNLKLILKKRLIPLPTLTSYIQWNLMKEISKDDYKVVISGNGADEMFSGYYDHYLCYFADINNKKKLIKEKSYWEKNILPLIRNKDFRNANYFKKNSFPKYLDTYDDNLVKEFSNKNFKKIKFVQKKYNCSFLKNRMKNEMFRESLPVILNEEDLNSMYFSIENRSPYLDNNIYNFMENVQVKNYINNGFAKSILRDSLKNIAPDHIINNYEKIGFNIDIDEIINFNSKTIREFLLKKSNVFNYISYQKLKKILNNSDLVKKYKNFLFKILNLKIVFDS
jgi:asparagine synthase (glutamine-hydrolysing)